MSECILSSSGACFQLIIMLEWNEGDSCRDSSSRILRAQPYWLGLPGDVADHSGTTGYNLWQNQSASWLTEDPRAFWSIAWSSRQQSVHGVGCHWRPYMFSLRMCEEGEGKASFWERMVGTSSWASWWLQGPALSLVCLGLAQLQSHSRCFCGSTCWKKSIPWLQTLIRILP